MNARAVRTPTPGMLIRWRHMAFSLARSMTRRSSLATCSLTVFRAASKLRTDAGFPVPAGAHDLRQAFSINRVSASLQLGWRMAILSVVDDGVVSGRSDGDCLASKPMEEQASCF